MTGRELWFLRQELGLSQAQLARLIRQDVQAVARWEKGRSRLPGAADRLVRLLYLGHDRGTVDVQDLLQELAETDAAPRDRVLKRMVVGTWPHKKPRAAPRRARSSIWPRRRPIFSR